MTDVGATRSRGRVAPAPTGKELLCAVAPVRGSRGLGQQAQVVVRRLHPARVREPGSQEVVQQVLDELHQAVELLAAALSLRLQESTDLLVVVGSVHRLPHEQVQVGLTGRLRLSQGEGAQVGGHVVRVPPLQVVGQVQQISLVPQHEGDVLAFTLELSVEHGIGLPVHLVLDLEEATPQVSDP